MVSGCEAVEPAAGDDARASVGASLKINQSPKINQMSSQNLAGRGPAGFCRLWEKQQGRRENKRQTGDNRERDEERWREIATWFHQTNNRPTVSGTKV